MPISMANTQGSRTLEEGLNHCDGGKSFESGESTAALHPLFLIVLLEVLQKGAGARDQILPW